VTKFGSFPGVAKLTTMAKENLRRQHTGSMSRIISAIAYSLSVSTDKVQQTMHWAK
jgi:hypothetical protein